MHSCFSLRFSQSIPDVQDSTGIVVVVDVVDVGGGGGSDVCVHMRRVRLGMRETIINCRELASYAMRMHYRLG